MAKTIDEILINALKAIENKNKISDNKKTAADARAKAIVMPVNAITNAAAEINVSDEKISVIYEKNDIFRTIVKSLSYKWTGSVWERKINELTGSAVDRAAELGNKLLNAGFPIIIYNENIRNAAINGQYEPECNRWILKVKDEDKLKIKWYEKNDSLYQAARKLPGSKWDGGIIVSVSHFREIEDFANIFGFKFTCKAREAIEAEKILLQSIVKVIPAKVTEPEQIDGLKEILNSSRDVLPDLIDN